AKHKWVTAIILLASVGGIWWASSTTPTGFVPSEDRGIIFANVELPAGATLDRTVEVTQQLYEKVRQIPGVQGGSLISGFSLVSGAGSNYALGFLKLKPFNERKDEALSANAIISQMFGVAATIPEANIIFFAPPSIPGFGVSSGFEMNVLDRFGGNFSDLDRVTREYLHQLAERPEVLYAQSAFNTN